MTPEFGDLEVVKIGKLNRIRRSYLDIYKFLNAA